ncbi:nucleoside 2-deoxyribosyltransferase [Flavobacterium anhuiense]|uniref:nucleoside 2-deoxyribosyltransferase n=1 Tax=Flavobacterium anhuiense TaxID=459526 RepID=UPI003D95A4AE
MIEIEPKICLVGDIVIDVSLKNESSDLKMRLGGIIHAARCLWALNIPFSVAYFAPSYLDVQINEYLKHHGCIEIIKIGNIIGAPYVFLIEEVKESGSQGYEFLLRDEINIEYNILGLKKLEENEVTNYLLISGNYDLEKIIKNLNGKIHLDIANNIDDISFFEGLTKKIETLFISTSSSIFKKIYQNDFLVFSNKFKTIAEKLILKENRGGSRGINLKENLLINVPAQTQPILHSVGVGDVYDATYVSVYNEKSFEESLFLSSWIATEYATTTYPDDFKLGVTRILSSKISDLITMEGVSLNWEKREKINIYIAAPDFDFVNTNEIDRLVNALEYHNFKPRRPIKENGQMEKEASKSRRQELFSKDMILLDDCSILVAVLLYNDPGTLIEIGLSAAKNIPTIVYDPYSIATNCMLTELPCLVSSDLDEIISEVFIKGSKIKFDE